ncbi:putative oligosaccharyl transferase stt3 protein [Cardiosporidium cionae]|uniref:dolichyl-diphosphooligosaccharide--protein glycotransferase n=1 Tax=Cardiosporidium cionae TaxID=476202 RepID=A0ABQ7J592_9APIC|nr:putative oligosaccharyl transferase stt3 protein [Cardiosporidium cionae]|eukprot:KAF8819163.1 putative oligosaccharyl transferase stt3 protein [Cardiosporidium cionae]
MAAAKVETSKFQLTALTLFREASQLSTENDGILFNFGAPLFDNSACRTIIRLGRKWTPVLDKIILALIFILCFIIRQFAVIRYESMIHEFDPYFNLRTTIYLQSHGFYEFWNWFDDENVNVDICVFVGPLFSGFTAIAAYLFAKEITGSSGAGLFSALFTGISPAYLSRSVAGSYDNEAVAIFAMVFAFYTWVRATNHGTLTSALVASLGTFYMVTTWGAYVFVINTIAVYMLVLVLLKKLTVKHHIIYSVYYSFVTIFCLNIPFVNFSAVLSSEHMSSHGIFLLTHVVIFSSYLRTIIPSKIFTRIIRILFLSILGGFAVLFIILSVLKKTSWSARSMTLLDPTYASKYIPIVASVSEHQPPVWASYVFDLHYTLLLAPLGLYLALKRLYNGLLFLAIYAILAVYFSGVMVRLMLVLSPAVAILAGIGSSYFLENFLSHLRSYNLLSYISVTALHSKKNGNEKKNKLAPLLAIISIIFLAYLCILYVVHSTWTSAVAYSHPSVVSVSQMADGSNVILDDFREAYSWFRYNTHPKARLMSWWDYGYQATALGNRTVLVDNNTWNNTHIATVGLAFSSNEEDAFQVIRKLDVDYVFVVFGGYVGYQSDDVNKFLWMVRISSGVFPAIQQSNYLTPSGSYSVASDVTSTMSNSLLYKLAFYRFHEIREGHDAARNYKIGKIVDSLKYFEEVFTSQNWMVRVYKVKPPPNRDSSYHLAASSHIRNKFEDIK